MMNVSRDQLEGGVHKNDDLKLFQEKRRERFEEGKQQEERVYGGGGGERERSSRVTSQKAARPC
jgi:hypothetical protein